METRHGLRQLTYMKELGMGNDKYHLLDIDENDKEISVKEAVKDVKPVSYTHLAEAVENGKEGIHNFMGEYGQSLSVS